MQSFVARQPIFDRDREVFGYELLFRSGLENQFTECDGDHASSSVINTGLHVHGMHSLTGGKKGFINITRSLLLDETVCMLPREHTVVELLETIHPDDEVIAACRKLRRAGYLVAMDDFVFDPAFQALLHEVDIVKIDFMATTSQQRREFARTFNTNGTRLLAEKVETHEEFHEALDLRYSYFQGYFFCKPQLLQRRDLPMSKLGHLRVLQQINQPELDYDKLERIIKSEVALSYKLLKYLNSASLGLRTKITSIKHGLLLLGPKALRKWASLAAMSSLRDSEKPAELLVTSLVRARFCELLGVHAGMVESDMDLFLMGMLSTLDALLDRPLPLLVSEMNLCGPVQDALLGRPSRLTDVYLLVQAYERGRWNEIALLTAKLNIQAERVTESYRDAVSWADDACTG